MSCCDCSVRCWVISLLAISLVFTVIRQGLDSWGRLYLSIIINFLHILVSVVGLFGAAQLRVKLLLILVIWWPLWVGWNLFVLCYYLSLGQLSRDSKILSLGEGETLSPVSPRVDGIGSRWLWILVQLKADFFREYWWIEVGFAAFQIGLSVVCGILALVLMVKRRNKLMDSPDVNRRGANQPRITLQLSDVNFRPSVDTTASTNNGYTSDTTGYLNASFDDTSPARHNTRNGKVPDGFAMGGASHDSQGNGTAVAVGVNYRRSSSERSRSGTGSKAKRHSNHVDRPNDLLALAAGDDGDHKTPVKVRHNSLDKDTKRKRGKDRRNSYSGRSKGRPESGEVVKPADLMLIIDDPPPHRHRKKSDSDDLGRDRSGGSNSRRSSHRKPKSDDSVTGHHSRSQQQNSSFRHIPTGNLQRLKHDSVETSASEEPADSPRSSNGENVSKPPPLPVHIRHQATPVKIPRPPVYRKNSNTDETLEVVTYNQEPKRSSGVSNNTYINCPVNYSPSGSTRPSDSGVGQRHSAKFQISAATSNESIPPALVSFDPKSNTLLRYHQAELQPVYAVRASTSICSDPELVEQQALPSGDQFEGIPVRSVHANANSRPSGYGGNDHMRLRTEQMMGQRDRVSSINSYDSGLPGSTGLSQRTSLPPPEAQLLNGSRVPLSLNMKSAGLPPPYPNHNHRELPPTASITLTNRLYGAVRQQEEPQSGSDTFNDNWSTSSYATSSTAVQAAPQPYQAQLASRPHQIVSGDTGGSKTQADISRFLAKYYGDESVDGRSEAQMYQPYQESLNSAYGVSQSVKHTGTPGSSAMASLFGSHSGHSVTEGSLLV